MTVKNIVLKINAKKSTLDTLNIEGGEFGRGSQGKPLKIAAKANVHYEFTDKETSFGPENIATKRHDKDLWISFEGGDVDQPDLIIENYYAANGELGYSEGESNLLIGQHENGKYYPYVPESAEKSDAVSLLADQVEAGQALGGEEVAAFWAFNPLWLLALVPIAAVAIGQGHDNNKKSPVIEHPQHVPIAEKDSADTKENTPVIIDVTSNDTDKDGDLDPSTVVITKQPQHGTVSVDPITGEVTYTPNKGYVGPDAFEYTVKDKAGNVSDPATVVIEVSANPVAVDDSAETKEDTPIIIDVTANDTDKDGDLDPSTVVISKQPQNGTVSVDPITGEVTYTPNKGYVGPNAFEYTVKDKAGNVSDPATVVIEVSANPVAVDDGAETKEDTPIIIDVTSNDSDKDGDLDPSTVVISKQPQHGTVSVDPITGEVTYTPNKGYVGPDAFEYTVKDKAGNVSDPATVVIEVSANPVAVDDSAETKENTPIIIDVTSNDTDKDGDLDPSTVVISKQPQHGTVSVDPITGEVTYTPNKGYVGPDAFEYTVKDKAGNVSDPAIVVIDITANPVAVDDSAETKENTPVIIDVTSNDTDKDGDLDPSTVVITKQPQHGTVSVDPITGEVTYTPNKGYVGPDAFEYTVKDKAGNVSDPAAVVVDITANPVAVDDSANTKEDTPIIIDVTSNDTDKDGDLDPSTVVISKQPQHGTVSVDPITGEVTYTPNKGYVGPDAFEYTVKDKAGNVSDPATVVIDITANPVAVDDSAETKEDTPIIIDVTSNDTDKDGDLDPSAVVISKQPQHGTVSIDPITGEVTYTPNKGYVGPDAFEYTVKDKAGNVSDPATVVVEVSANPVAVDDSAETKEDTPIIIDVTSNDSDKDGDLDPSTVVISKQPQHGTVSVDPITGEVSYTPNKGYVGPDTFEYTVKDKAGNVSDPATVVIEVSANPVAVDDSAETKEDTPIIIDVTSNDTDKDGDLDPSTVVITKQPQNGTVSVDPITGEVTYTPNKGYVGPDQFEYTVKDKAGNVSDPATVLIDITANPVAVDDSAETKEDTPIIIDVTSNDTDKDGDLDPSTVVITKQPQNGTVSVDPITGEVTYTPNKGYVGPDAFEYTVKDKAGTVSVDPITGEVTYTPNKGYVGPDAFEYTVKDKARNVSDPATVVIDITANPVAVDDSANTKEDTPIIIDVTSNDTDKDGDLDPSTVVISKQPQHGTVSIDPITGEVTYTPNKGYVGPDAFEYTVKDKARNVSDPATVVIEVSANPVAVDDSAETKENTPIIIDVTSNDTDKDGDLDPSTVVISKQPQHGTVSVDPITGEVTYTPNKGYVGPDAFEYTVKDKAGNVSDPAHVTLDISPTGTLTEILKEADLGDGSTAAVVNGELSLDNPSNADISDILMTLPTVDVTSGGETINWTQTANGGLVGTTPSGQEVMSITLGTPVTSNGKTTIPYEIGLKAPVDHVGENSERLDLDFGINTNIGDANLIITVEDDKSVAAPISVVADGETTFYANVIISLDLSSSMGARDSGIPDPVNGGEKMRMNAAVEAIETMLDKYQEQLDSVAPGNGDVKVNIIGFSKLAKHLSLPGQTDTWVSLDDAKKIVKGLYNFGTRPTDIGVDTNYDAALQEVIHSYLNNQGAGPVVGVDGAKVNNSLLFVSDGIPNFGNGTDGVRGIQPTSPSNYEPGNQNIDIGEDKWTAFLKEQNIKSIAIGIGPQMDEGADFLKPIAFDGEKGTNKDGSSDIIILKDMSDLGGIMSELVPEATDTQGSIRTDDVGNIVSSFGADGAGQLIIQIDGYDYTYDYATNQITSSNSNASIWQDAGNGVLMVKTEIGGSFKLNMSADKFGDFSYNPASTRPVGKTQEEFTFTLVDKDGDKSSDKLLIDIQLIPEASASKTALSMSNQLDHLEVFNAVGHTLDGFANTPNPAEAVNTNHINVSQHLEQLSVEQPNLI